MVEVRGIPGPQMRGTWGTLIMVGIAPGDRDHPPLTSQGDSDLIWPILKHSPCDIPTGYAILRNLIPYLGNQLYAITAKRN